MRIFQFSSWVEVLLLCELDDWLKCSGWDTKNIRGHRHSKISIACINPTPLVQWIFGISVLPILGLRGMLPCFPEFITKSGVRWSWTLSSFLSNLVIHMAMVTALLLQENSATDIYSIRNLPDSEHVNEFVLMSESLLMCELFSIVWTIL